MNGISWKDSFLLGIEDFDKDHRRLVELLNKLYEGFTMETHKDTLKSVLDELMVYAHYHFSSEERWMSEVKYPRLLEHEKEHIKFANRIREIQLDFRNGNVNISTLELFTFLTNWLTDHILNTDADYAAFQKGR